MPTKATCPELNQSPSSSAKQQGHLLTPAQCSHKVTLTTTRSKHTGVAVTSVLVRYLLAWQQVCRVVCGDTRLTQAIAAAFHRWLQFGARVCPAAGRQSCALSALLWRLPPVPPDHQGPQAQHWTAPDTSTPHNIVSRPQHRPLAMEPCHCCPWHSELEESRQTNHITAQHIKVPAPPVTPSLHLSGLRSQHS